MNNIVTANDLKIKGISLIESYAKKGMETIVKVRGEEKYVILTKESYNRLREFELTSAILEAEADLKNGKFHSDSIEKHIKRITNA